VRKDFDKWGASFREGEMVLCALWQSGRDASKINDPDRFDIDRKAKTHLNFSTGPHLCLGHALARAEMRIMAEEWMKRIPSFRATSSKTGFRTGTVCAINSLPLVWDVS
jgi:cytochrome P450